MNPWVGLALVGVCLAGAGCAGQSPTTDVEPDASASSAIESAESVSRPAGELPSASPGDCPREAAAARPTGEHVALTDLGVVDRASVSAAIYPLPDGDGNPWSQWGQGVVLPDGRFVSALGDHLGIDGNAWFYEYDPATDVLTRTSDVASAVGHESGDWGYGKVHAQMGLDECGQVLAASFWGTRRELVYGDSYSGDHLLRYDPSTAELTSLGVPVAEHGIPSMAFSPDGRVMYGEAVDPASDPDSGVFFAADAASGEVLFSDDNPEHVGFRSMLVAGDGDVYFSLGDRQMARYQPGADSAEIASFELPGDWLRAASSVAPNGSVYGVTRDPDHLFELTADGAVIDMGPTEGYVTSVGLSADGGTLYYVPDAHGGSWRNGTPLIAVDTSTGKHEVVVELNPLIEDQLGVRAGGTYNLVMDPYGGRIYIGLNSSEVGTNEREKTFGSVVLAVVEL